MKPILTHLLIVVAIAVFPTLSPAQNGHSSVAPNVAPKPALIATPAQPLTIAVLDFHTSGREFDKKGEEAAALLTVKLSAANHLILVERQELEKIFSEQELGLGGNVTPDTAAKVGQLTGAKVIITGRVFGTSEHFFAVAKIISTETGRVYGESVTFNSLETLDTAIAALAPKVLWM